MPHSIHVVKTSDFIRLDARGNPDLAETRRVLERIAKTCFERDIHCALLDVRNARTDLGLPDLYHLASAFHSMGFRESDRLAILHRYSGGEKAEFFALCASTRGWQVRAYDNYEEAMKWFTEEEAV